MKYKYFPIPENIKNDVVFLEVVKPLFWINRESKIYHDIPVGAITWVRKILYLCKNGELDLENKDNSICPENNRHCANYDPSCFKILHTSTQKIRK